MEEGVSAFVVFEKGAVWCGGDESIAGGKGGSADYYNANKSSDGD